MKKTIVKWQFNPKFRIRQAFRSLKDAREYADRVKRLWHIESHLSSAR